MSVKSQRILIRGCVQGVGYRDAAVQAAFEMGVQGWVRNRRDGSVEALVQGEQEAVERFVGWCRRGPPLAKVSDIAVAESDVDAGLDDFAAL